MVVFTTFVSGYIRLHLDIIAPSDVIHIIASYSEGRDGSLCIKSNETVILNSDIQYEYTSVMMGDGAVLSVNDWSDNTKQGGTLLIESLTHFIIAKGAKIDLNNKGYKGGTSNGFSGGTYLKTAPLYHNENKPGGGGGGGWTAYGGGGGYGTAGTTSTFREQLQQKRYNGGGIYGDEKLTALHLGSGGGSCSGAAGNGGGALKINCFRFENNGQITANGGTPERYNDGGGSGGSIFVQCHEFVMNNNQEECFIHAVGGQNTFENDTNGKGGNGGCGRIRIDCANGEVHITKCVDTKQIIPKPYVVIHK